MVQNWNCVAVKVVAAEEERNLRYIRVIILFSVA